MSDGRRTDGRVEYIEAAVALGIPELGEAGASPGSMLSIGKRKERFLGCAGRSVRRSERRRKTVGPLRSE